MFRVAIFLVALLGLLSSAFGSGFVVTSDDSGKNLAKLWVSGTTYAVLVSSDYGKSWNSTTMTNQHNWIGLASDGSGKKLALSAMDSSSGQAPYPFPYVSKDEGATWTEGKPTAGAPINWNIASDGSGNNLVAGTAAVSALLTSTDGGSYWDYNNVAGYDSSLGDGLAYSADGTAIVYASNRQISKHKVGTAWGNEFYSSPAAVWNALSTSSNGSVTAGAYNVGYYANAHDDRGVYVTTDWKTFSPLVVAPGPAVFNAVSVTDDGSLVFYGGSGGVYVYTVSTKTTVQSDLPATTTAPVLSIATSETGKYVVVGTTSSVWTSSNYGKNFTVVK